MKVLKTSQGEVEFVRLEGESGGRPGKATKRPWAAGSTSKRACGTDFVAHSLALTTVRQRLSGHSQRIEDSGELRGRNVCPNPRLRRSQAGVRYMLKRLVEGHCFFYPCTYSHAPHVCGNYRNVAVFGRYPRYPQMGRILFARPNMTFASPRLALVVVEDEVQVPRACSLVPQAKRRSQSGHVC